MKQTASHVWILVFMLAFSGCIGILQPPAPLIHHYEAVLLPQPYPNLEVVFFHVEGYEPSETAVATLDKTLRELLPKERIELIVAPEPIRRLPDTYTPEQVTEHLEPYVEWLGAPPPGTYVVPVFYVNGKYSGRDGVVGFFDPPLGVILLMDVLRSPVPIGGDWRALGQPGQENVERSVLIHEFGHVMGLVDMGVPMVRDREDPEHQNHSENEGSVMYWKVNSRAGLAEYIADNKLVPYKFDADDIADIRAFQEAHGR